MRATGVVRRIDDLGRIVIPKEIRRTMHMREGDALEIFTEQNGQIILKKYSMMENMTRLCQQRADSVYKTTGIACAVCDTEKVTAFAGPGKKEAMGRQISRQVEDVINTRQAYFKQFSNERKMYACAESNIPILAVMPIINSGDCAGAVALLCPRDRAAGEGEKKLLMLISSILAENVQ